MPKRLNWTVLAIAAACVGALLVGLGLGLFLFQGSENSTPSSGTALPACTGDMPAMLNDSTVPEPGPALEAALKDAIATYFMCQSLPIEQFARTFATLSVVIAQYAPDPTCFNGNTELVSANWTDHKRWADRQGRADLLMANLRLKIGSALGCLQPDQQRLFYTDMARAFAFAASGHALQTFVNPTFRGERVDRCLDYARECNEPAALAWCQRFGYSRMTSWEWINVPRTVTLGDKKVCAGTCGAFTTIICAQ